jgi:hypothetical protein
MTVSAILAILEAAIKIYPMVAPLISQLVSHAKNAAAGIPVTESDIDATLNQYGTNRAALAAAIAAKS